MEAPGRLTSALDAADGRGEETDPIDAELLAVGEEVRSACAGLRLPEPLRRHVLVRALSMAPPAPESIVRRWALRLRQRSRASALVGGTAVVTLAAIGITVAHQRRSHAAATA